MSILARVSNWIWETISSQRDSSELTLLDSDEMKEGSKVLVSFLCKNRSRDGRSDVQFEIKWIRKFEEEEELGLDNGPII
jgi:hypothetical protein